IALLEERGYVPRAQGTPTSGEPQQHGEVRTRDEAAARRSNGKLQEEGKGLAITVVQTATEPGFPEAGNRPTHREAQETGGRWTGVPPHGGRLVQRVLEGEARQEALRRARELPAVELDERELADVEMIGCGALSPLVGFMGRLEYETVVGSMRLADGLLWPLPITLAATREETAAIRDGQEVALVTPGDRQAIGR